MPGGGAIANSASLTLSRCSVTGNSSFNKGGAVLNSGGSASLIAMNCTFAGNTTYYNGGAIWNDSRWVGSLLRITNCTFLGNESWYDGGAVYSAGGDTVIASSTIAGNKTDYGSAGGVFSAGDLTLQNSIVSGSIIVYNYYGYQVQDVGCSITSGDYNLIQYTNGLVASGTQEIGNGIYTIMTQVAADTLNLSPEQIDARLGDTIYPQAPISAGSMSVASVTPAVQAAAQQARAKLLAVAEIARTPTGKHAPKSINYGWQPFRDILVIMLDTGMRPAEVFRMRWEHMKWERELIFVPRSKSRKSKRFVGITERVRVALLARKTNANEGWVFHRLVPSRAI